MKIEIEENIQLIYSVMTEPEIWERITDDYSDLSTFTPPDDIYLSGYCDGELIGMARFSQVNPHLFEYHPMVFQKYRKKYSVEFHDRTIQTIKKMVSDVQLIALIPACFRDVYFFARRNGWQLSGKVTQGIKKHNKLQDINIVQYVEV